MEEANGDQNHTQNKNTLERLSTLKRSLSLTGVKVPMRQAASFQMKLAPYLLNKPYSANIIQDDANSLDKRVILLKEGMNIELEGLPQDLKTWLESQKESGLEVITHNMDVDFKSYSLEQLMKLLLPSGVDTTLKIENIRDIKIFDLTEEQMKYKDLIGKIILEKSLQTQCILLKTRYRNESDPLSKYFFEQRYELLTGEPNTEIEITEGPCTYKVNLLKVFYDSAFQEERERLLSTKNKDDIICDVFGDPFYSIRAAKENRIHIAANCNNDTDLSNFYTESVRSNHVDLLVDLQNRDLYPFLRDSLTKTYTREGGPKRVNHLHISKFLEDPSFLKFFVGLFKQINDSHYEQEENLPLLHFYIYVANEEFTDSMRKVLSAKFNNLFNEAFKDKEIKDILDADDFQTIFIVHDDPSKRKLLHCTIKLSKKLAYCPEILVEQIVTLPMQVEEESKESKESNEPAAVQTAPQTAQETVQETAPEASQETAQEASQEPAKEAEPATEGKSAKKSSSRKKKEIIHKPSKDAEALEQEIAPEDDGGLRRSSRKKTKSKQYDDYEYQHSGSKESSK